MKSTLKFRAVFALMCAAPLLANSAEKKELIKTGLNLGPLPVIAYDADKGFQYGAIIQLFDYGDGSNYPNYDSKWYIETSFFTKGSQLYQLMYDNKTLIPGARWSSAVTASIDKGMDFFGFNGYQSYYDHARIAAGKDGSDYLYSPFYRFSRKHVLAKSDLIFDLGGNFKFEIGYHASYFSTGSIDYANINKGKSEEQAYTNSTTLYEDYVKWGLISEEEAEGGFSSSVRAGIVYDSRDKEGAPTRGIWAETHITAAPKWLGTKIPFYRYSATWRQYLPLVDNDVLTFAYRLNYEGTFGKKAPYYILPFITVMGENGDKDGMGGYRTVRGIMRDRVVGLDMASYNAEFRWRFASFQFLNQNIALGLSAFSDGTVVTKGRDMSLRAGNEAERLRYDAYMKNAPSSDKLHITAGAGFRFIMNENFIVAAEYGTPLSHFYSKSSPLYNQDGTGAFYLNVGYLF